MIPTKERSIKQTLTFFTFTSLAIFRIVFAFALSHACLYFCPHSEPQHLGTQLPREFTLRAGCCQSIHEAVWCSPTRQHGDTCTWWHCHQQCHLRLGSIDRGRPPAKKKDTEPTGSGLGVFSASSQRCWCRPQVACSLLWVEVTAVYENTKEGKRY